jgi:hypothetical protein
MIPLIRSRMPTRTLTGNLPPAWDMLRCSVERATLEEIQLSARS